MKRAFVVIVVISCGCGQAPTKTVGQEYRETIETAIGPVTEGEWQQALQHLGKPSTFRLAAAIVNQRLAEQGRRMSLTKPEERAELVQRNAELQREVNAVNAMGKEQEGGAPPVR